MAQSDAAAPDGPLGKCTEFLGRYYKEEILDLAHLWPDERSLWINWQDLWQYNPDLAEDLIVDPDTVLGWLSDAVAHVDHPVGTELHDVTVRVTNLSDEYVFAPGNLRTEHADTFVGVHGTLERATTTSDLPVSIVFSCQRCPATMEIPQYPTQDDIQEPHECDSCERKGPFEILHRQGEWADYAKIRVKARPDASDGESGEITGYVLNDLIDHGGDSGLLGRVGEPVTVTGTVERVQKSGRGENKLLFDHFLAVNGIEFHQDAETVDVPEHRETFEQLAARDDAVDLFAESIAPNLHTTNAWDVAFEFAVAYLFGAPRIDIENGPSYRGDLHFLIISDFGMGKSDFANDIDAYSPKCIHKSTTALSSGVGLTAAAVEDDFGEGAWTIKPGLLVRANNGHLILDEIDKGPTESLTDMNDALEGRQQVDVEKAGMSVTYNSRTGLLALGNPKDGRFHSRASMREQLGIPQSLLSRFDGIVTMEDEADEEQDEAIAGTFGKAYTEAQRAQYGDGGEFDVLDRPVPIDVGRAWIQYAREHVNPVLSYEQFEELKEWYAEEARNINKELAKQGNEGDIPVPATVRVLGAAVKMSIAFARARLQDEVQPQQIERAKHLGRKLVAQNYNDESGEFIPYGSDPSAGRGKNSQKNRNERIEKAIREGDGMTVEEIAEEANADLEKTEHHIQKLRNQGRVYEPETGEVHWA